MGKSAMRRIARGFIDDTARAAAEGRRPATVAAEGADLQGDGVWQVFANVSEFARQLRGQGEHALAASHLVNQCPPQLMAGLQVLCPWFSRACASSQTPTLAMAEDAGRFASGAQLPPRQLMGAERCTTPTCLGYVGTARKPTGGGSRGRRAARRQTKVQR